MIRVFGTRWIPFEEELDDTTASAKGLGIHGVPWTEDSAHNLLPEILPSGNTKATGASG